MNIELDLNAGANFSMPVRPYVEPQENIALLTKAVCDAIAEENQSEFIISGFGQEQWPLRIRMDLALYLEDLPFCIAAIESKADFEINFPYRAARTLKFRASENNYIVSCISWTEWIPNPMEETIDASELYYMLCKSRDVFLRFLSNKTPWLYTHPWIRNHFGLPK